MMVSKSFVLNNFL